MRIINFNGLGKPKMKGVEQGDILILYAHKRASVVKLNILPPEKYGPELIHAKNSNKFESDLLDRIAKKYPDLNSYERHWILECPNDIKVQVEF